MRRIVLSIFAISMAIFVLLISSVSASEIIDAGLDKTASAVLPEVSDKIKPPVINATAAVVMDAKTGRILFEKNATVRKAVASTTKIMTAILALEKGNLNDVVTVSQRAASVWGSDIKLRAGEKLTLEELLYGLMLNSGNDAAIAIAEHIGGSVEQFAEMMTAKAKELGAHDTQFVTPHGLDTPGHFSTARDMAVITRYALQNPLFCKIVSTHQIAISGGRTLHNTNELLGVYQGLDGVKTGYTGQAGRCLVTTAERNGMRLIGVVLGSPTKNARSQSSRQILDYGFKNYEYYDMLDAGQRLTRLYVVRGIKEECTVFPSESITLPLRKDETERLRTSITLPDKLNAPVKAGDIIGSISFSLDGEELARTDLKLGESIRKKNVVDYFKDIIDGWAKLMKKGS